MIPKIEPEKYYRVKEAAGILGTGPDTVRRNFRGRQDGVVKLGTKHITLLILERVLIEWIRERERLR